MESRREMESNLFEAARTGERRQSASQNAAILDARTKLGNTALHVALSYGQEDFATELCRLRRELLWDENNRKETPLHKAAASWNPRVLEWLQELLTDAFEGAEQKELLRRKDAEGNTALHRLLTRRRHLILDLESIITDVATAMLGVDTDLSLSINNAGESPLYLAARTGWPKLVSCLLQFPSPPGNGGPCGRSPLHVSGM